MSLRETNDFAPVTSSRDRAHVFELFSLSRSSFSGRHSSLTGYACDDRNPQSWTQPFRFELQEVVGETFQVIVRKPVVRSLNPGEVVEIFFGLDDGKYVLRAKIGRCENDQIFFDVGGELLRLQRRNNFRVTLPYNSQIRFLLKSVGGQPCAPAELTPVDLSAGGIRLRWKMADVAWAVPKLDEAIAGVLMTGDKQMELSAVVRTVAHHNEFTEVGFEFTNVSNQDEQALIFLCLQIYRAKSSVS